MYYLLNLIKFKNHEKNTGKWGKSTGKVREKSGNFVSPEKWEPCSVTCAKPKEKMEFPA